MTSSVIFNLIMYKARKRTFFSSLSTVVTMNVVRACVVAAHVLSVNVP